MWHELTIRHPHDPRCGLDLRKEEELRGYWLYREAVGSWMQLSTMTIPGISNAMSVVARHSHNPTDRHWKAVMNITSRDQWFRTGVCEGLGIGFDGV